MSFCSLLELFETLMLFTNEGGPMTKKGKIGLDEGRRKIGCCGTCGEAYAQQWTSIG